MDETGIGNRIGVLTDEVRCTTAELWEIQVDRLPVLRIPIDLIAAGETPRLQGESSDHAEMLAQSDAALPPIVVHRPTMRVIDGMHRLKAAVLSEHREIEVRYFDGEATDAFLLGVKLNTQHGLPLTRADRNAAAARIVSSHPQWSDRMIAAASGLSPKTVGAIRRRSADDLLRIAARIGLDGRSRLVNSAEARRITGEFVLENPDATLREIARNTGVALGTARDVRARLRRGESAMPNLREVPRPQALQRVVESLPILRRDPSVRSTDHGRLLLRVLNSNALTAEQWSQLIDNIPAHCTSMVAGIARECADSWHSIAEKIEERARTSVGQDDAARPEPRPWYDNCAQGEV